MRRALLNLFLYFPSRAFLETPASAGLAFEELHLETADGERLHGWWVPARSPRVGHLLLCHGNAGNVGDRVIHAALLSAAGFDVLLFDYRGYGRSSGRASEEGTYEDARAARSALLGRAGVDGSRVIYLGESLGGAIALELALAHLPAGLVLQSTFTSVRDVARKHYPFIPKALVSDAYPSIERIGELRAPLLVLHGERDELIPLSQGQELFEAAPEPKQIQVLPACAHNDLVTLAGDAYAKAIGSWAEDVLAA